MKFFKVRNGYSTIKILRQTDFTQLTEQSVEMFSCETAEDTISTETSCSELKLNKFGNVAVNKRMMTERNR